MDQVVNENNAGDILRQMKTYKFNMPVKVSLILEDSNSNDENPNQETLNARSKDSNNTNKTLPTIISCFNGRCHDSIKTINKRSCLPNSLLHTPSIMPLSEEKLRLLTQLDTVSIDLIRVIKFYYDTTNNYNYNTKEYEKARDNYLKFKGKIFNKSYSTAASIFVPNKKNVSFITKFIKRTKAIAQRKSSCIISDEVMKNIISDLILWTQLRTTQMSSNVEYNQYKDNECHQVNTNTQINVTKEISTQLKDKTPYEISLTFKRYLHDAVFYDKIPIEEKGMLPSKKQKVANTSSYLQSNPLYFNTDEVGSKKNDNLDTPRDYLMSISQDSGIRSPSCTSEPCEQMVFTPQDELQISNCVSDQQVSDQMFSSSNTLRGQCSACKILTKSMCLGCQKIFYCSLNCQNSEWATHKKSCRK